MIILIGFPKSGTSSFQTLFAKLGYKSAHWTYNKKHIGSIIKKNKNSNKPLLSGLKSLDCITQMDVCISKQHCYWPQLVDYKQLYYENRDYIFILNKRSPEKILDSMKRWGTMNKRLFKYNPELIQDKTDNGLINYINKHFKDVENFFEQEKDAKFISFDIEDDNISKLKKYIDIKDFKKLPHSNKNK